MTTYTRNTTEIDDYGVAYRFSPMVSLLRLIYARFGLKASFGEDLRNFKSWQRSLTTDTFGSDILY